MSLIAINDFSGLEPVILFKFVLRVIGIGVEMIELFNMILIDKMLGIVPLLLINEDLYVKHNELTPFCNFQLNA